MPYKDVCTKFTSCHLKKSKINIGSQMISRYPNHSRGQWCMYQLIPLNGIIKIMRLMLIDRAGLRLPCMTFSGSLGWNEWQCEVCDSPGLRLIGGLHCVSQASHASLLAASLRETDRTCHTCSKLPLYKAIGTQCGSHTRSHNKFPYCRCSLSDFHFGPETWNGSSKQ